MAFDDTSVARYEAWFKSPAGAFALRAQLRMLEGLLSPWPRRGQKLLDIGCGPGLFLQALWEAGFDVTGLDAAPAMVAAARQRLGQRADLHLGRAEHLPFDDKEFDFTTLFTVLEFCEEPAAVLAEAVRVSRKGVLVGFLNRWSLYHLAHGLTWPWTTHRGSLRQAHWLTAPEVGRLLRQTAGEKPCTWATVLLGPRWTWREGGLWGVINGRPWRGCLGAICAVRCDLHGDRAMTPLLSYKAEPTT